MVLKILGHKNKKNYYSELSGGAESDRSPIHPVKIKDYLCRHKLETWIKIRIT